MIDHLRSAVEHTLAQHGNAAGIVGLNLIHFEDYGANLKASYQTGNSRYDAVSNNYGRTVNVTYFDVKESYRTSVEDDQEKHKSLIRVDEFLDHSVDLYFLLSDMHYDEMTEIERSVVNENRERIADLISGVKYLAAENHKIVDQYLTPVTEAKHVGVDYGLWEESEEGENDESSDS